MSSILVVDDVSDIRLLCRIVLEGAGHVVSEATTAERAMTMLDSSPPDSMLLDVRLPGMDGWEALRLIRGRPDLHALRVIVFSAHASPEDQRRAEEEGAAGFLGKPFSPDELLKVIQVA